MDFMKFADNIMKYCPSFTAKGLSNFVVVVAVLLVLVQFFKEQVQQTEDDAKDKALTDSTAKLAVEQQKVIELQGSLIKKHEELNIALQKANKVLADLNDYVTGGNNKPILSYSVNQREPLFNSVGQQVGSFYRVKFYLSNIGTSPIPNVTIKFLDYLVHTVTENGVIKEGIFEDGWIQIQKINLITRSSIEPFHEIRIPSNYGPVNYKFVVGWQSDYYHVGADFKISNEKNTVELVGIEYLDRDKKPITDINSFIGFKVKSLKDYYWGKMFEAK